MSSFKSFGEEKSELEEEGYADPYSYLTTSAQYYFGPSIRDILYSNKTEGQIVIEHDFLKKIDKLVTTIDLGSVYQERRLKAFELANKLSHLSHPNLLNLINPPHIEDKVITFETEAPIKNRGWQGFCKKKFNMDELLDIAKSMASVLSYLHENGIVHRDVHPIRIH